MKGFVVFLLAVISCSMISAELAHSDIPDLPSHSDIPDLPGRSFVQKMGDFLRSLFGETELSPKGESTSVLDNQGVLFDSSRESDVGASSVRAGSCDADGICEADRIVINSSGQSENLISIFGRLNDELSSPFMTYIGQQMVMTKYLGEDYSSFESSSVQPGKLLLSNFYGGSFMHSIISAGKINLYSADGNIILDSENGISASYLKGNNSENAYACIDLSGMIYRSEAPCR